MLSKEGVEHGELVSRAQQALSQEPVLRLAVLFGSYSTGRAHPGSDVDIAIIPKNSRISLWDEGLLNSRLEVALGCAVDLVRLDLAPTLVRWEVLKNGILLLADPPEEWTRQRIAVMAEHADYAPAAERVARSVLQRIADAGAP